MGLKEKRLVLILLNNLFSDGSIFLSITAKFDNL